MMSRQMIALGLLATLLAACAAKPPAAPQVVAQDQTPKPLCDKEYRVGSMMPRKDCTAPMSEEERQRLQADLANKIRPGASAKGGG